MPQLGQSRPNSALLNLIMYSGAKVTTYALLGLFRPKRGFDLGVFSPNFD